MEAITQAFETYALPAAAISVMVIILTFFTKKVVEVALPKVKKQKLVGEDAKELVHANKYKNKFAMWWNEVILYAVPVVWGAVVALGGGKSEWLFPGGLDTIGVKLMFGIAAGWFSSFFYKVIRKMILKKTGVDIQPGSIRVPAPPSGDES